MSDTGRPRAIEEFGDALRQLSPETVDRINREDDRDRLRKIRQRREGGMNEHQVNRSGVCEIPGCPCRGWSAQETAGKTQFWVSHHGSDWHLKGAPCAQCDGQHQPAARGGGEEWSFNFSDGEYHIREQGNGDCIAHTKYLPSAKRIIDDHNQHQSLVAERERLRAAIEVAIHNLNAGNDPKFLADYLRLTLDQQRSTSE